MNGTDKGQAAAEMDDLQSQLEQGNSELLQEEPLLVKVLTQDAAGLSSNLVNTLSLLWPLSSNTITTVLDRSAHS